MKVVGLLAAFFTVTALANPSEYFGETDNEAYLAWTNSLNYQASVYLASAVDETDGAAVHWSIKDDMIELGIAARASGWIGFGMSDNGGMKGSDIVLFEADKPDQVKDTYVLEERTLPTEDDCQDWELVEASTDTNFLLIQVKRKLDTGDSQDFPIIETGPDAPFQRIIAAWGDNALGFHNDKVARGGVNWFNYENDAETTFQAAMAKSSTGSFYTGATDYVIKPIETEYPNFCVTGSQLSEMVENLDDGLSIIGYEPVVATPEHVHHFTVYASKDENNDKPCDQFEWYVNTTNLPEMVYVWTPGEPSFTLPEDIGAPLGGEDGFRSFIVEIHYDNPKEIPNITDSSGVRFYYGDTRPIEMGVLQLGDPFIALMDQTVGVGVSEHVFECDGGCAAAAISEPVTVLREYLHMHEAGTYASNQQLRNGEVIRSSDAQFFDFDQQGNQAIVQAPFEVQPGDAFKMTCKYRDGEGKTFGLASSDEMCIAFLFYYPRQKIDGVLPWMCGHQLDQMLGYPEVCGGPHNSEIVSDDSNEALPRPFGAMMDQCPANVEGESTSGAAPVQTLTGAVALMLAVAVGVLYY